MRGLLIGLVGFLGVCVAVTHAPSAARAKEFQASPGQLDILDKEGKSVGLCPLQGTRVSADIAGFGARVTVVQTFRNPASSAIEALYTFPLPNNAAVDRMRMKVGTRVIEGQIRRRDEARQIYEAAKSQGKVAALLDQERPNIFTQSVANIMPGAAVEIEISYLQVMKYEEGEFEFTFPMTIGPRYVNTQTPDPQKVTPPIARSGANITLSVSIAGADVREIRSPLHEINQRKEAGRAVVSLKKKDEIPNRDFILRYKMSTQTIGTTLLDCPSTNGTGYFTLILMPPQSASNDQIRPKEMLFIVDQSGSQRGFPIEKSKELTKKLIDTMGPDDTFNVIGFSNQVNSLWPNAVPNTPQNRQEAKEFVSKLEANGGTELLKPVLAALQPAEDAQRVRIVLFNTDGFIGNEREILAAINKHRGNARMFTFGIGNSVNRYLIDSMAVEGRGDAEYVTLAESADAAVERLTRRLQAPILTDIQCKFEGVLVEDVLPKAIPDVFSEKPVVIMGRYTNAGTGSITISGNFGRDVWSKTVLARFPSAKPASNAVATLWARGMVDELQRQDRFVGSVEAKEKITRLALDFGIMTEYTSFVAVEERVVNVGGKQQTVHVPVEAADGVDMPTNVAKDKAFDARARASLSAGLSKGRPGGGGGGAPPTSKEVAGKRLESEKKDDGGSNGSVTRRTDPAQTRQRNYETRVSAALRAVKNGPVSVQVALVSWDIKAIQRLKALGFKLEAKDEASRILFGTVDAKKLIELAQVDSVKMILPLRL